MQVACWTADPNIPCTPPSSPTAVLAVRDPAQRMALRVGLTGSGFDVPAVVGEGDAAVAACAQWSPAVCLVDVSLPGGGGEVCRAIRELTPDVVVVMLGAGGDADGLFDALAAGARGYLDATAPGPVMVESLRAAIAGEVALGRPFVTRIIEEFQQRQGRRKAIGRRGDALTEDEWDVLEAMVDDLTIAETAAELGTTERLVRMQVRSIVKKLGVVDREAAVDFVRRQRGSRS